MPEKTPKRFLSIRLTEAEFKEVNHRVERSTCLSLTEYVKKLLTGKQVVVKVRNESQDQLLEVLIRIKTRLDKMAECYLDPAAKAPLDPAAKPHLNHTVGSADPARDQSLLNEITAIKSIIQNIAKTCSLT